MNIKEKVFTILQDLSGAQDIEEKSSLQEELALDSLALVFLLVELEDSLEVEFDESDMNPLELVTAGDVLRLAEKYGGGNHE